MSDSTRAPSGVSYVKSPSRDQVSDNKPVEELVSEILKNVRGRGDAAVREYSEKFDKSTLSVFEVTHDEREEALRKLAPQTRQDTEFAIAKVEMQVKLRELRAGAVMLVVASVLGFFTVGILLAAAVLGLSTVMPAWAAALVVAGALLVWVLLFGIWGAVKVNKNKDLVPHRAIAAVTAAHS